MESIPTPDHTPRKIGNIDEFEPVLLGDVQALISLQRILALTFYHALHPEQDIDPGHPDSVDRTTRNEAMQLWLDGGDSSLSARFRTYADTHPQQQVSVNNEEEIGKLFESLGAPLDSTIH